MKRLITALILGVFLLIPGTARAETLTVVADVWCPYNCDPNSDHPGYIIEIAQKAFARHGIEVKYMNMPWARAIEDARQHKYDAIVGAFKSDAPDFVFPELAQGLSETVFYVKKGNPWRYTDFASVSKISVGVIVDYAYGEPMDAYIEKNRTNAQLVQEASGDNGLEINLKKLVNDRIGAIMDDSFVVAHYLSQHSELKDQVEVAGSYSKDDDYMAFSPGAPNSEKYAQILSTELAAMRASGELQQIMERYGLTDFVKPTESIPASEISSETAAPSEGTAAQ